MLNSPKKDLIECIQSDPIAVLIVAHALCDMKGRNPLNKMRGLITDEAWEESLNHLVFTVTEEVQL